MPVLAIVLTLVGDFIYLNFGVGLFVGFAASGLFVYWITVLFITTVGVLVSAIVMIARPELHRILGVLVLAFSVWAISADEGVLLDSFSYAFAVVGSMAFVGVILWNIPLACVLVGGALAILWKPPAIR